MHLCQMIQNDGYRNEDTMTKVIMHGCNGHMGQVISKIIAEEESMEIVAGIDPFDEGRNPYPVFHNIDACDVAADVLIDFSNAKAIDGLLNYCESKKLPVVLCFGASFLCSPTITSIHDYWKNYSFD